MRWQDAAVKGVFHARRPQGWAPTKIDALAVAQAIIGPDEYRLAPEPFSICGFTPSGQLTRPVFAHNVPFNV